MPQGVRLPAGTEERHKQQQETMRGILPTWLSNILNIAGMGPDTPIEEKIMSSFGPSALTTTFTNKAARQAMTSQNMKKFEDIIRGMVESGKVSVENADRAWAILEKYPRVVAHITDAFDDPNKYPAAESGKTHGQVIPEAGMTGKSALFLNPEKVKAEGLGGVANTLGHELTHVAQFLGLKKRGGEIQQRAQKLFGPEDDPFERSAYYKGSVLSPPTGQSIEGGKFAAVPSPTKPGMMDILPTPARPKPLMETMRDPFSNMAEVPFMQYPQSTMPIAPTQSYMQRLTRFMIPSGR
jgi:hypothetical protein